MKQIQKLPHIANKLPSPDNFVKLIPWLELIHVCDQPLYLLAWKLAPHVMLVAHAFIKIKIN